MIDLGIAASVFIQEYQRNKQASEEGGMTIDLDVLESLTKRLLANHEYIQTVPNRIQLELIQRLREAEKSKARYEFCVLHGYLILDALEVYTYDQAIADREIDAAIDQQRKIATGEDLNL